MRIMLTLKIKTNSQFNIKIVSESININEFIQIDKLFIFNKELKMTQFW